MVTVLWGLSSDEPLASVHQGLLERGAQVLLLDQRRVDASVFRLDDAARVQGEVGYRDRTLPLESIAAWYVRPYDTRRVPSIARRGPGSREWRHALELEDALLGWLEVTSALVVNRPSSMLANACKPYQQQMIARAGFETPETLITTDPRAVAEFCDRHHEVIYKSISGVRSHVSLLSGNDRERLADITHCPTQFQAYIPGTDYRVHVVGTSIFACEVRSAAIDYRRSPGGDAPLIQAARLPRQLEGRVLAMTRGMDLHVAGVDLRRTPEGRWYCFEVNPSPGFTFYEQFSGQGIAGAIARLLLSGAGSASARRAALTNAPASRGSSPP